MAESLRYDVRDGVAVLTLDLPDEPVNTLSPATGLLFDKALSRALEDTGVTAVVFTSGKPDGFVAGADVRWLGSLRTKEDGERASREGQEGFARLAAYPKPVVAAIHGACLGGGLEWALACTYRLCSDAQKTQLGLPEVQLGLLPGAGGTQRLPRLIGIAQALDLILTGKSVRAAKAKKLGLVDEVVPAPILLEVALQRARALADKSLKVDRTRHSAPVQGLAGTLGALGRKETWTELALEDNPLGRAFLFDQARKQLRKKTRGHYPAPEKALDVVRTGTEKGLDAGLKAEAQAFGELLTSEVSHRLREIFFATTELKKDRGVSDAAAQARPVRKVAVLGGGLMGGGIAYVSAVTAGLPVRVKERDDAAAGRALAHVRAAAARPSRQTASQPTPAGGAHGARHGRDGLRRLFQGGRGGGGRLRRLGAQEEASRRGGRLHAGGMHFRLQHLLFTHCPYCRRRAPAGPSHRHALLQPGGENAAAWKSLRTPAPPPG